MSERNKTLRKMTFSRKLSRDLIIPHGIVGDKLTIRLHLLKGKLVIIL